MLSNGFILVISGPSGTGKTSLVREFLKNADDFSVSISHTTRKIRAGEKNGSDYYFVSDKEFDQMVENGDFVEWANVFGNKYGSSKKEFDRILGLGKNVILEIDVKGAKSVMEQFKENVVSVFILADDFKTIENRLRSRATDSEEVILQRIFIAKKEIESINLYDYVIINKQNKLNVAINDLKSICCSEKSKTKRFWNYYKDIFWR